MVSNEWLCLDTVFFPIPHLVCRLCYGIFLTTDTDRAPSSVRLSVSGHVVVFRDSTLRLEANVVDVWSHMGDCLSM